MISRADPSPALCEASGASGPSAAGAVELPPLRLPRPPGLWRRRLRPKLLRGGLMLLAAIIGRFSWRGVQMWGRALGRLIWLAGGRDRRRTLDHLRLAFPALEPRERLGLARACFRHHGTNVAECLYLLHRGCGDLAEIVAIEGWDEVERVRAAGQPLIFITGHCGNWELMGAALSCRGHGVPVVARPLEIPDLEALVAGMRRRFGTPTIARGSKGAARQILGRLRRGEPMGFLIDQDTRWVEGVWVPYFGRPARTPVGPAKIALRLGAQVIPAFIERQPDGRHRVRFHPALDLPANPLAATALMTAAIEAQVRRHPEQWVWMHRRWRRAPPPRQAGQEGQVVARAARYTAAEPLSGTPRRPPAPLFLLTLLACAALLLIPVQACRHRNGAPHPWTRTDLWLDRPRSETAPAGTGWPRPGKQRIAFLGAEEVRDLRVTTPQQLAAFPKRNAGQVRAIEQLAGSRLAWHVRIGDDAYASFIPLGREGPRACLYRFGVRDAAGHIQELFRTEAAPLQLFAPAAVEVDLSPYLGQTIDLLMEIDEIATPGAPGTPPAPLASAPGAAPVAPAGPAGAPPPAKILASALWGSPELIQRELSPVAPAAEPASASVAGRPAPAEAAELKGAARAAGGTAEIEQAAAAHPNVLLIGIDTLRADALGAWGRSPSLTPALDRLAQESDVWLNAFTAFNVTNPSFVSMMSGLYGKDHGVYDLRTPVSRGVPLLAEGFRSAGYDTMAIISARHLGDQNSGLGRGFGEVTRADEHFAAELATDMTMDWIAGRRAPFFAWLHLFDPHTPHTPPEPFANGMRPAGFVGLLPVRAWVPFRAPGPRPLTEPVCGNRDLYDGEVAYLDRQLGRLLDFLESRGLLAHTLVAVVADHGENLGEHGIRFRHAGLYDTTTHVPLLIRWPGTAARGRRFDGLVQTIDLFPTLLSAARLPVPPQDGSDLRQLTAPGRNGRRAVFAEHSGRLGEMVRTREYKYFVSRGNTQFVPDGPALYDLKADPGETRNLAGSGLPAERELAGLLAAWLAQHRARPPLPAPANLFPEDVARLNGLGYGETARPQRPAPPPH